MIAGQHLVAYGATLILVAVSDSYLFYLQLGDGDILAVSEKTGQVEQPLPHDASLMANETTSLCLPQAQKLFRFRFQFVQDGPPALILLSTDGYSNSFATIDDFQKTGIDLLHMIQAKGLAPVKNGLKRWLGDVTRSGSGDDVSLGLLCRKDIVAPKDGDLTPRELHVLEASDRQAGPTSTPVKEMTDA